MDMNKSKEKDNFYMDDLLDQMEKGELKSDSGVLYEPHQTLSFNQRFVNKSKRLLKFYRQKSDTSLEMNMSISSDTSNESDITSPFIEDEDQFNWELSKHDYESKIDDSNLDEFYGEYREFILDTVPRKSKPNHSLDKVNFNTKDNYKINMNELNQKPRIRKGKYHSFKQISNSL